MAYSNINVIIIIVSVIIFHLLCAIGFRVLEAVEMTVLYFILL